jgi:membrane protein insertase Oxa1/YidC/SpoIIIJ
VTSIFPFIILAVIYIYDFLGNFNLYLGLDELRSLLTDTSFLIIFWLHFIAINLFCGSWIVRDSQKYMISKILIFFPLIITYFTGPVGIFIYWLIRIFFAKRISLYD